MSTGEGFSSATRLIVGLGNPGKAYAHTRHNIGFLCLNYFARKHQMVFSQRKCYSQLARGKFGSYDLILAKPLTFMNQSGRAIAALIQNFELPLTNLIVIYDDMDLPFGQIRIRPKGGAGGHNGMKSIIEALGTEEFPRLRVGIGRPNAEAISYVLSTFSPQEKHRLNRHIIPRVAEALECLLNEGLEAVMNKFNR